MPASSRALLAVLSLTASGVSSPAFPLPTVAEIAALRSCSVARASGEYFVLDGWVFTPSELRALRIAAPGDPANLFLSTAPGR